METNTEKKPASAGALGLLLGLSMVICTVVVFYTKVYMEGWAQMIGLGILFIGVIGIILFHAKQVNYSDTFGRLFSFGSRAVAAATVVMILYTIVQGYVFPDLKIKYLEATRIAAYNHPEAALHKDAIEQNLQMMENNYTLFIILTQLFWYLIIGVIACLVGAAVSKRRYVSSI